jgi:hypothetical protein
MAKSTASQIEKRLSAVESALGLSTERTEDSFRWQDGTPRGSKPTEGHKKTHAPVQPKIAKQEATEKTNCILDDFNK